MIVQCDRGFPNTPAVRIPLQEPFFTLCDPELFDDFIRFHWYAKKSAGRYYACRKVTTETKVFFIRMHRVIAATPVDMVCHHINGNTLDNRRANLLNMTEFEHAKMFSYR